MPNLLPTLCHCVHCFLEGYKNMLDVNLLLLTAIYKLWNYKKMQTPFK